MVQPRRHGVHSAWGWRTFPFFGYHVVKFPKGGGYVKIRWVLSQYKARCLARDYRRES